MTRTRALFCAVGIWTVGGCIFDSSLKHDLGVVPAQLDDGWQVATPESVGLSSAVLAKIHDVLLREDRFPGSLGMLVVKDDKLVWETYLRSMTDRDSIHHVQSVTKSVVALTFGIARERGHFDSLTESIGEIFPDEMHDLDPRKATITLEDLLTMRSGIDFDNEAIDQELFASHHDDPLRYILEKPLFADPGQRFSYRNADPQILSYAIQRKSGASTAALAQRYLFAPLGIEDFYWQADADDGVTIGGNGLHLRPRDLAKLGELVLDHGAWAGRRIVSDEWITQMTSAQVTSDELDPAGSAYPYGYYWWIAPGGYCAWGNGGQFLLVVPAKHMVIVHVALPDTSGMDGSTLNDFLELVHDLL